MEKLIQTIKETTENQREFERLAKEIMERMEYEDRFYYAVLDSIVFCLPKTPLLQLKVDDDSVQDWLEDANYYYFQFDYIPINVRNGDEFGIDETMDFEDEDEFLKYMKRKERIAMKTDIWYLIDTPKEEFAQKEKEFYSKFAHDLKQSYGSGFFDKLNAMIDYIGKEELEEFRG